LIGTGARIRKGSDIAAGEYAILIAATAIPAAVAPASSAAAPDDGYHNR